MNMDFKKAAPPQQHQERTYTPEQEDIRAQQAAMQEDARSMAPGIFHDDGSFAHAHSAKIYEFPLNKSA